MPPPKSHTKWINMMCFKGIDAQSRTVRDFTPFNTQISPPGSNSDWCSQTHLGIKAPDETRSIYRTMAAVDSGCEPLNVKVFQAWLLAVTHHVDVLVYWIEHTELEGLYRSWWAKKDRNVYIHIQTPGYLESSETIYTYKRPCQRFICVTSCRFNPIIYYICPTSHCFCFRICSWKFAFKKSVLYPPTTAGFLISNMKMSCVSGLICNGLQCPQHHNSCLG